MRVLLVLAVAACATSYRSAYTDRTIGPGRWLVTVKVNGYTSSADAEDFAYRRAAELCPGGYDILSNNQGADISTYNGQVISKPTASLAVACKAARGDGE